MKITHLFAAAGFLGSVTSTRIESTETEESTPELKYTKDAFATAAWEAARNDRD